MSRLLAAAGLVFAVCGAASSFILGDQVEGARAWVLFPLPFGLLCAFLCLTARIPVFVILSVGVWNAAYWTTYGMYSDTLAALAWFTGGLIGGLGLAASAGFGRRAFWQPVKLASAAVIGGVAGLAFLWEPPEGAFVLPFAVWQGAVGTYLFAVSRKS